MNWLTFPLLFTNHYARFFVSKVVNMATKVMVRKEAASVWTPTILIPLIRTIPSIKKITIPT
jgi:hypothetical protein